MQLVLASSSPARRMLLTRLGLPFACASPDIDETPLPAESPASLVRRLALEKAQALAPAYPDSLLIGCDQVCVHAGRILGKPGDAQANRRQLAAFSGDSVDFFTGLVLYDSTTGRYSQTDEPYRVVFRSLNEAEIHSYVERERPWHCAGGFMAEGLGISLFESLQGRDFHALIGLPLIALTDMLRQAGLNPLSSPGQASG